MKRVVRFLRSMNFAVALLVILSLACILGSVITQGQPQQWYAAQYSERAAAAIYLLHLDDVFHSWWFTVLSLLLCLSLILCSVTRFPTVWKRYRAYTTGDACLLSAVRSAERQDAQVPPAGEKEWNLEDAAASQRLLRVATREQTQAVFAAMHCTSPREDTVQGRPVLYASRNRTGIWGEWICHVGILILILGFGLGQVTKHEDTVYGVPGQSKQIGDTSYILSIDDFSVALREDDTVEQYTSQITIRDAAKGAAQSASVSVNAPASLYGMKVYQNSTGWAATVTVLKGEEEIQQEVLCAGEVLAVVDKDGLEIVFSAFYPDVIQTPEGTLSTQSSQPVNPGYLYRAYYMGNVIGMNVLTGGDYITIDEYTITFTDPQPYTLLQIKRDRFGGVALSGGILIVLGLIGAFYLQPMQLWAVQTKEGDWTVGGRRRRGEVLFQEQLAEAVEGSEHLLLRP